MEILNRLNYYKHIYNTIHNKEYRYYYHFSDTFKEDIITIKPRKQESEHLTLYNDNCDLQFKGKCISISKYIRNCVFGVWGKIDLESDNLNIYTTDRRIKAYQSIGGAEDEYYYFKSLNLIKAFSIKEFINDNYDLIEKSFNNFDNETFKQILGKYHIFCRNKIIETQQKENCPQGIKVITQEEEEA